MTIIDCTNITYTRAVTGHKIDNTFTGCLAARHRLALEFQYGTSASSNSRMPLLLDIGTCELEVAKKKNRAKMVVFVAVATCQLNAKVNSVVTSGRMKQRW